MGFINVLKSIWSHPGSSDRRFNNLLRFIQWQISSRISLGPTIVNYVGNSKFIAKRGLTGITGNIYVGLHEFEDMMFVLHALRPSDLFVDIGANVGSYTILAGAVACSKCISIEPLPEAKHWLEQQVSLNNIGHNVEILNIGIGSEEGFKLFTTDEDTVNHVVLPHCEEDQNTIKLPIKTLDSVLNDKDLPTLIKIDVEGFEMEVINGGHKTLTSKNILAIIMELNGSGKRYGYDDNQIHEKMHIYGFNPYSYLPSKRNLIKLEKNNVSGNTIYIKDFMLEQINNRIRNAEVVKIFDKNY